MIKPSKYVVNI